MSDIIFELSSYHNFMSLFKTSGLILKIQSLKETEFLFDVFTLHYGKLKLKAKKSKKEKSLDIGYMIDFEVNVKKENTIHEIRNIKIKNEFSYTTRNYDILIEYLKLIQLIGEKCPYHLPISEIYTVLHQVNTLENISDEKIIFSQLKVLEILGILKTQYPRASIQKILSFIEKESIETILKLKGLSGEDKSILEKIIHEAELMK